MNRAVTYLNDQQPGEVQMGQMNLIPFMNFPDVSLQLRTVVYYEQNPDLDTLNQEPILAMEEVYVTLDVMDLIRGDIQVSEARLADGFVRFEVYEDSISNLENALGLRFGASASTDSAENELPLLKVNLDKMELRNIQAIATNRVRDQHFNLKINQLVSSMSYLPDRVKVDLEVNIEINKVKYLKYNEETTRIIEFSSAVSMDPVQKLIDIKPSRMKISDLELETWGTFGYDSVPRLDMEFKARNEGLEVLNYLFRGILDLEEIEQIGSGSIELYGDIHGHLGEGMPVVNIIGSADQIGFRIKSIQKDVTNISFSLMATNGGKSDFSDASVEVNDFSASFPEGDISANVSVYNMVSPELKVDMTGEVDLFGLEDMIHIDELSDLEGKVTLSGQMDGVINRSTGEFLNDRGSIRAILSDVSFVLQLDSSRVDSMKQINGELFMLGHVIGTRNLMAEFNGNMLDLGIIIDNLLLYLLGFDRDVSAEISIASDLLDLRSVIGDTAVAGMLGNQLRNLRFNAGACVTKSELDAFIKYDSLPEVSLSLDSFGIDIPVFADVSDMNASLTFGPDTIALHHLNGVVGESEFNFSGMIANFGALGRQDSGGIVDVVFDISSELMRAEDFFTFNNEFLLPETYKTEYLEGFRLAGSLNLPAEGLLIDSLPLDFGLEISDLEWNFRYYPLEFNDFFVQIRRMGNRLFIDDFQGSVGESNLKMSATLENFTDTVFENLKGSLVLHSDLLDFNQLLNYQLPEELQDTVVGDSSELREPPRLDQINYPQFDFTLDVGELRYGEYNIYGMKGKLRSSRERIFYLDSLVTSGESGGEMAFYGQFNVSNPWMYTFSAELNLKEVDINDLAIKMQVGEEIYSLRDNFDGILTANGLAEVFITPDLKVDMSNTTAIFNVRLTDGALINFKPLQAAGKYLDNKNLDYVEFATLRNGFTLMDSKISIPVMNVESTVGQLLIEGEQGLDNSYLYLLRIPPRLAMDAAKSVLSNSENTEGEGQIQEMKRGKFLQMTVWSNGIESDFKWGDRREKFEE